MITGTTNSGFSFEIPENAIDNMELVDALAEVENGNGTKVSDVCKIFLGDKLRKRLYDHLRTEDGRVPVAALTAELKEMFDAFGQKGKNSSSSPE